MTMRSRFAAARLLLVVLLAFYQSAVAQEPTRRVPSSKPQAARLSQKETPAESADKQEPLQATEDGMRQTLDHLAAEIKTLGAEVQRLRKVTERNAQNLELVLNEDRLSKVEDKIQEATDRKFQLDARELDLQRRMKNIPTEMLNRTTLRKEDAEAAVKAELQRGLDDVRNQQSVCQQRLIDLNTQAERLRARVETLRKKVDQVESTSERQDQ